MTTGAQALITSLLGGGVEVCFANPGTSEMHFVAALDDHPDMRAILCLFEGVATGAADGYWRVAGKPAATLLHLGPGLANGLANLHNARRAHSGVVNIVGDHATYHRSSGTPLASDIGLLGDWLDSPIARPQSSDDLAVAVMDTVAAARVGRIATLVLPADVSWSKVSTPAFGPAASRSADPRQPGAHDIDLIAGRLTTLGDRALLLIGGAGTSATGLIAAQRISQAVGTRVLVETFPARLAHGRGVPNFERLGYLSEQAVAQLAEVQELLLAGAQHPVGFFAYPDKPTDLVPEGAAVLTFAAPDNPHTAAALERVADALDAPAVALGTAVPAPELGTGPLTAWNWVGVIANLLPDNAIISDESNTSGLMLPTATRACARHDLLTLTGGAIGQGLPVAIGAAVAAPDRPVIALQADGSALYTITALWTMAREHLDVTVVLLNNRAYAILQLELQRVGAEPAGDRARQLLELDDPDIDFVSIARGLGVSAMRATTVQELAHQFQAAVHEPGPHLIEAMISPA